MDKKTGKAVEYLGDGSCWACGNMYGGSNGFEADKFSAVFSYDEFSCREKAAKECKAKGKSDSDCESYAIESCSGKGEKVNEVCHKSGGKEICKDLKKYDRREHEYIYINNRKYKAGGFECGDVGFIYGEAKGEYAYYYMQSKDPKGMDLLRREYDISFRNDPSNYYEEGIGHEWCSDFYKMYTNSDEFKKVKKRKEDAEAGDRETQCELAALYLSGGDLPDSSYGNSMIKDLDKAAYWYKKAMSQDNAGGWKCNAAKKLFEDHYELVASAERGDVKAQYDLAKYYVNKPWSDDDELCKYAGKSVYWYEKVITNGATYKKESQDGINFLKMRCGKLKNK